MFVFLILLVVSYGRGGRDMVMLLVISLLCVMSVTVQSMAIPSASVCIRFCGRVSPNGVIDFTLCSFRPNFRLLKRVMGLFFNGDTVLFLTMIMIVGVILVLLSVQGVTFQLSLSSYSVGFVSTVMLCFTCFNLFCGTVILQTKVTVSVLMCSAAVLFGGSFGGGSIVGVLLLFKLTLAFRLSSVMKVVTLVFDEEDRELARGSCLLV